MKSYGDFALVYDRLMSDADYDKRTRYILKLFAKWDCKPKLLLDVGCGTGAFSNRFAKKGIEVIGVDMSEDMLSVARENSAREKTEVLYLCQKAEELDLYGTVDSAVFCMDGINHITDEKKLKTALSKISLFLEPGGVFIFDANTVYKHEKVLADNVFAFEENGVYCVWKNSFCKKTLTTDISLDFFVQNGDTYERYGENFPERAYETEYLKSLLFDCGFEVLGVYGDMSDAAPTETDERIYFAVRKI